MTLAEATQRYEQGMLLVRRCNQLLDAAQLKITTLKDTYGKDSYELSDAGPGSWESVDPDAPGFDEPEPGPEAPPSTGPLLS